MIAGICNIKYIYISEATNFPFSKFVNDPTLNLKASHYGWSWKEFKLKGKAPKVNFVSQGDFFEINFSFSALDVPSSLNNKRVLLLLETRSGENYLIGLKNTPVTLRVGMAIPEVGAAFSSNTVEVLQKQVYYPARWTA